MSTSIFSVLSKWRILPLVFLILYSFSGGLIFNIAERGAAMARRCDPEAIVFSANSSFYKTQLTRRLAEISSENLNSSKKMALAREAWQCYTERVHAGWDICCNEQEAAVSPRQNLTLSASLYYAVQVYTTIGYGDVVPSTVSGKLFTMVYSLFGIPLLCYILDEWGTLLAKLTFQVKYVWNAKVLRRSTSRSVQTVRDVPLSWALLVQCLWLCLSAALLQVWEKEWDYFSSFYFFFISCTTIGLGDVVPKYPSYALVCSILVLFGLAQVSMCINLLQWKIDVTFQTLLRSVERVYVEKQSDALEAQDKVSEVEEVNELLKKLSREGGWQNRLLLEALGKGRRDLVVQTLEKRTACRNVAVQAAENVADASCQTVGLNGTELSTIYLYSIDD